MSEPTVDVLDRDARTLYDLACIRAKRDDATREDVEAEAIALRLWQNLAAVAELVEVARKGRDYPIAGEYGDAIIFTGADANALRAALARLGGAR